MSNVVALVIMVVGTIILAIYLSVSCGKRKLSRHKNCSRRDPHVPGEEARKVSLINLICLLCYYFLECGLIFVLNLFQKCLISFTEYEE